MAAFKTEFGVIELSTAELLSLDPRICEFLVASSFIMNDVRFYWSLMARAPIDENETDIRAAQLLRWLWCCRKLASVVYEADIALGKLLGSMQDRKEFSNLPPRFSKELRKSGFMNVAKKIRNKSAYHYETVTSSQELANFKADSVHRLFAHAQRGNSLRELGEQIFTLPLLRGANEDSQQMIIEFEKWLRRCSKSLMHFCETALANVISLNFPDRVFEIRHYAIDQEAAPPEHRWPLFLVADKAK